MRLLNARTLKMEYFLSEDDFPPFAILSHTWGKEEVKYAETLLPGTGEGWRKIKYTCQQAIQDQIDWVWIDTCCIDKSDSAELSESINSMFRWYQMSTVCYAYLADVSVTARQRHEPVFKPDISQSRWFTRGWTLQELVAPRIVWFYSKNWEYIGSKTELCSLLSSITRIAEKYLTGHDIFKASIAQRMSWASRRQTTRKEDIAYCLFGIFDINMPSVYGEGTKAFRRLQLAIIEAYPEDQTIFAWGTVVAEVSWLYPKSKVWADTPPTWEDSRELEDLGLLASSPKDFEESGQFVPTSFASEFYMQSYYDAKLPTQIGNTTFRLDLPVHPFCGFYLHRLHALQTVQIRTVWYAALFCGYEGDYLSTIAIPLRGNSVSFTTRTREILHLKDTMELPQIRDAKKSLRIGIDPFLPQKNDIIFRRLYTDFLDLSFPSNAFPVESKGRVVESQSCIRFADIGTEICMLRMTLPVKKMSFNLYLSRVPNDTKYAFSFQLRISPVRSHKDMESTAKPGNGRRNNCPSFSHTFTCPTDEWIFDVMPLPRMFVRVEKVRLDSGFVDVVDLVIR